MQWLPARTGSFVMGLPSDVGLVEVDPAIRRSNGKTTQRMTVRKEMLIESVDLRVPSLWFVSPKIFGEMALRSVWRMLS